MIALDVADLVVIAGQVLGIDPGAALDQVDLAAARAALAEAEPAQAVLAGSGPADAGLAAAVLIRSLLRHHPFAGHAQQIAAAAALQFLSLNGWQVDLDPPGAALVVLEGLTSGQLSPTDAAAWLSARLSPYSAPPGKEAPMRTHRLGRRFRALNPKPVAGVRTPVTGFIPFTNDTCDVVVMARQEAIRLGLDHPGPEQYLTGLIATGQGIAAEALKRLGISAEAVRQQLTQSTGQAQPQAPPGPDTPPGMTVMPQAVGEAVAHGHDYIGTEHLLLALFRAGDDTAARALVSLGAGEREVRGAITAVAGQPAPVRRRPGQARKPVPRDDEIRRLRREVTRLGDLLREHGIDPGAESGAGGQRSA